MIPSTIQGMAHGPRQENALGRALTNPSSCPEVLLLARGLPLELREHVRTLRCLGT